MSSRPPVFTWNEGLHFGPASEPIHIQTFINQAQDLRYRGLSPWLEFDSAETPESNHMFGLKGWQQLPEDARKSIEEDCAIDDLTSSLSAILSSTKKMHYLQTAYSEARSGITASQPRNKGKGKQTHSHDDPDLDEFRNLVDHTPLRFWTLKPAAAPYFRGGHFSDQNALQAMKLKNPGSLQTSPPSFQVIITLTAYTRNTWYPFAFSRDSQHALLSSNTLADLWSCISCALGHCGSMPKEVIEVDPVPDGFDNYMGQTGRVVGYEAGDVLSDPDHVVMVVEDVAYSNSFKTVDYADMLLTHLDRFKQYKPHLDPPLPLGPYERPSSAARITKGPPLDNVELNTLTLRINEPYWVLHRGSCEHWFVINEIRLQHPKDPTSGYPIELQRTPVSRPLCRICTKVPATLSIINEIRLGESPCLVCQPCWELFGGTPQPKQGDDPTARVFVVPLVTET